MNRLKGKVALVTGAAAGIGAAVGKRFAAEGARVIISDAHAKGAKEVASAIGGETLGIGLDVRSASDWERVMAEIGIRFGGIDILVNNAGIEIAGLIAEFDMDACRELFDVNVFGVMLGMKYGFADMRPGGTAGRGGAILNLSSTAARMAPVGLSAYAATKAAVERLTKVGAVEAARLGYQVRVNCIYPGMIETAMAAKLGEDFAELGLMEDAGALRKHMLKHIPANRYGTVEEVADAAIYLCSDESAFVTGAGLVVDGGVMLA